MSPGGVTSYAAVRVCLSYVYVHRVRSTVILRDCAFVGDLLRQVDACPYHQISVQAGTRQMAHIVCTHKQQYKLQHSLSTRCSSVSVCMHKLQFLT